MSGAHRFKAVIFDAYGTLLRDDDLALIPRQIVIDHRLSVPVHDVWPAGIWKKEGSMKLSARNVLKGKIVEVKKGATTAHVRIQLPGGAVITSSITNEAVDELRLASGDDAYAVIKASDVMVGRD
jgi:molybdopterin-binding protein